MKTTLTIKRLGNLKRSLNSLMKKNGLPINIDSFKMSKNNESFVVNYKYVGELTGVIYKEIDPIKETTYYYIELLIK